MTPVGVVGASARAAVHSLARAGFSAWAIDLFADRDLKRVAPCAICPADRYPEAVPELAARFPPGPVLYTGGLENHPHVIRELASQRELWGNPPEVLARVRDPFAPFWTLAATGCPTPRIVPRGEPCPAEGRWLRKPFRSGGGVGIRFAKPGEVPTPQHYFQEFIDGTPMSALFVNATLFGITEQLIGEPWLHAKPFAYCGNIGPTSVPRELEATLYCAGHFLSPRARVFDVWGLDFIESGGIVLALELNPRYTASAEVLEHALPCGTLNDQAEAFPEPQPDKLKSPWHQRGIVGKAVYYAPHTFSFPHNGPWDADLAGEFNPWRLPGFADIPEAGSRIEAGSPVLTFFATGSTPAEVRERLQSRAAELDQLFRGSQP